MFSLDDILISVGGETLQKGEVTLYNRVCTDSRSARDGDIFVALKGPRFDGHEYIPEAAARGAVAILCSKKVRAPGGMTVVRVQDTFQALARLAAYHRARFAIPVIAITGSVGKTTTKELLAHILSKSFRVLKSPRSFNNHIGVPLTLLELNPNHQAAVVELGTNQPGDIDFLGAIVQPTVALITNIGDSHLERLKSRQGVFQEKRRLLKYLPQDGIAVLNMDDDFLRDEMINGSRASRMTFGLHQDARIRCEKIRRSGVSGWNLWIEGNRGYLRSPARANISNALAAVACARALSVALPECLSRMRDFSFSGQRQQVETLKGIFMINDSYNANPQSYQSAIETLEAIRLPGEKFLVCGDMLELGNQTERLHRDLAQIIEKTSIQTVLAFGPQTRHLVETLRSSRGQSRSVRHYATRGALHRRLKKTLRPGDQVLIKGSRGMEMDKTVAFLKEHFG